MSDPHNEALDYKPKEIKTVECGCAKKDAALRKAMEALKLYSSESKREPVGVHVGMPLSVQYFYWSLRKGKGWIHYTVPHDAKPWDAADAALAAVREALGEKP